MAKRFFSLLMFIICVAVSATAQQMISGTVTDESGLPLPGATVQVKGTTSGTVTNADGKFEIQATTGDIMVVQFVGYLDATFEVDSRSDYSLQMQPDAFTMEEMVVVGYGTQRKSDVTGATNSVDPDDLMNLPVSRADIALQGRSPGVVIQNDNASPNSEPRIRIRGSNSFLGNNAPLIVIDGFQDGDLNLVHPNDIVSMEVLKDASALAIYGSKGANGAILITTKSGAKGKVSVNYSNYFALHEVRAPIELLDAAQYARRQNQDAAELGGSSPFTAEEVAFFDQNGGTSWQDEIFQSAFAQNHHLIISGSSEKLDYAVTTDVLDQEGVIKGNNFSRYALRGNFTIAPTDKFKIDLRTSFSRSEDNPGSTEAINSALTWSPTDAVFLDEAGKFYTLPDSDPEVGPNTSFNPVALAVEPIIEDINLNSSFNTQLTYEFFNGLSINVRGAAKFDDRERGEYRNNRPTQIDGSEFASVENNRDMFLQASYFLNYKANFSSNHNFDITALFEEQYEESNGSAIRTQGFLSDAVGFDNLGLGENPSPPSSFRNVRTLRSYMTRFNYGFADRLLVTFSSRWDASSVFGANQKWAFFPSVALGWNVSNEAFFAPLRSSVNDLKVRASYGATGNQAIPPAGSIGLIGDDFTYPVQGNVLSPGVGIADRLSNPDLQWETTRQLNIGVNTGLFNGLLNLTFDYYVKTTHDLLFELPVPQSSGSQIQFQNVGSVENRGMELLVDAVPIDKAFVWETSLNFARNRNKVLELFDGLDELTLGDANTVGFPGFDNYLWLKVGQPVGQFRGVQFDGVWQLDEAEEAALYGAIPGSPKAVDLNGDTLINDQDRVFLGTSQPDFSYGWNNTLSYKNFDFNIFIQGVHGLDKLNLSRLRVLGGTGVELQDRWSPLNPDTDIPSRIGEATYSIPNSDRFLEDASYLRIKNISIGYSLPASVLERISLTSFRVYVSGFNLFTFTNYSGYDPESTRSSSDLITGVDLANYPAQKIYTLGFNIGF